MKKILRNILFGALASSSLLVASTSALVACGDNNDAIKTKVAASAINAALTSLTIKFAGNEGNGTIVPPTWNIANTKLTYGVSTNSTPPTSYNTDIPSNLTSTSTLYVSAVVSDEKSFELDGTVIPKVAPVTGLNVAIDVNAVNSALKTLNIVVDTTQNDGHGTYTAPTNYNVANTTLEYAFTKDAIAPADDQYTNMILASLSNGGTLWAKAIPANGYFINGNIVPFSVPISGLKQVLDATPIERALATVVTNTQMTGTLSGSSNFSTSAWSVTGTKLKYNVTTTNVAPTTWIDYSLKPATMTLANGQYIWYTAEALSGYSFASPITPTNYTISTLNTGVDLTSVNNALIAINGISTDDKNNGHATLQTPIYSVAGTELIYAVGEDQPELSTFTTTLPTNLSNDDTVWITAKATQGHEIAGGSPSILNFSIKGLNEAKSFTDVQTYMNAEVDEGALGLDGLSGEATFLDPAFADHYNYLTFEYKKTGETTFSDTPPTNIANGNTITVRAKLLTGFLWDNAATTGPTKDILITGLTNPVLANDVNDALNTAKTQITINGSDDGQGYFTGAPWDTTGNTKIAGTQLTWAVTLDATAPQDNVYTRDTLINLYNGDYIWLKAFADDTHEIVGQVNAVSFKISGLTEHITASEVQTELRQLSFTTSIVTGNSGEGRFNALTWPDTRTKLQYGTSSAAATTPTNWQDTPFTNLSNNQFLFVTAVALSGYAIDGNVTPLSFEVTGLKNTITASVIQTQLDAITITPRGTSGTGTFDAPTWGTGDTAGTTLKYAKSTLATTPADSEFNLTAPPVNITNNDYIYITAVADATHAIVGSLTPKQIQVTTLKSSINVDGVNTKLKALTVSFTGTSGNGDFTLPTWDSTTGVQGTTLKYGISADQTTPPTFLATKPAAADIIANKYLWITAEADSSHTLSAAATPKKILIQINQVVDVAATNTALTAIQTGLLFEGYNNGGSILPSSKTWSIANTKLVFASSKTNVQPALSAFTEAGPTTLSIGDYVWITAVADTGYVYNVSPSVLLKQIPADAGITDATAQVTGWANMTKTSINNKEITFHSGSNGQENGVNLNAAILIACASDIATIKALDANSTITIVSKADPYSLTRTDSFQNFTAGLTIVSHGVTINLDVNMKYKMT